MEWVIAICKCGWQSAIIPIVEADNAWLNQHGTTALACKVHFDIFKRDAVGRRIWSDRGMSKYDLVMSF